MSISIQQSSNSPAQNLWDIAVTRLSVKDKAYLDFDLTVKLDELLLAVQNKRQECEQRRWAVKQVVLRDVFTKIAKWIQKFIEVGDTIVQFDPGHAALPWAALRFLLKVVVEENTQYVLVVEGVEKIANIITRYRIVERLYLAKQYEATINLQDQITDLYVVALRFLVKAKKFFLKNTAMRALQTMTDFNNKLRGYLESIVEIDQETKKYAALVDAENSISFGEGLAAHSLNEENRHRDLKITLDNMQMPIDRIERKVQDLHDLRLNEMNEYRRLKSMLDELQMPIDRIERGMHGLHDMQDDFSDAKRAEILQWLSPIPYEQHHNQVNQEIMAGTGLWFLNDDELLGWRGSSTSSIMWLRGIAGSGKSKLISLFVQQQMDEFYEGKNPNPIYFYCTRNPAEPERSQPDAILRSLVRQLSSRNPEEAILEPVRRIYKAREKRGFGAGPLTLKESTALIIELTQSRQLTTIIVDALDECEEVSRRGLLDIFKEILQTSSGLVKILVSSREVGDIIYKLDGCLNLEILASKNRADIIRFVDWGVDDLVETRQLLSGKVSDELRQEIKQVLCEKAGGMFRWVSLQLDFLRGLKWEPAVRSRLRKLPTKLLQLYNETYTQKIESCAEEEQTLTKSALRMLLCLQIPLRTRDFMLALCSCESASLSAEQLLDLCSNFVVLDTGLDVFRFAHLSVREFLETKEEYEPDKNHALIAEMCLRYLSTSTITQSSEYWNNQFPGSDLDLRKDRSTSMVLVHKHPSKAPAALQTTSLVYQCNSCKQRVGGIFWTCRTLEDRALQFCENCVENGRVCKSEDRCLLVFSLPYEGTKNSPLKDPLGSHNEETHLEASISTLSTVPTFIDGFHQYSGFYWPLHLSQSKDRRLSTPLQSVSCDFMTNGQQTASPSFVSWSNTMLRSNHFPDFMWGYDIYSVRVAKVLEGISQPADCIFVAAIWGFCDILELRLEIDPETVNMPQVDGFPALHLAIAHGHFRATQILLEKGAKLEERNPHGGTALELAIETQNPEFVRLLLERGADSRANQGSVYPLLQAVSKDHLVIIQLLLEYGSAPECQGTMDDYPMTLAAVKGNEEAMKLFVNNLTHTDGSTKQLWTMVTRIQKAMRTEGEAGLSQSLRTWPTSTTANQFLGRVLYMAVLRNDEACARLLLARGADPNTTIENKSVFDVAARAVLKNEIEHLKVLEMLLAHGATPDMRKYRRGSIECLIVWGVNHNMLDLVRVCADTGANLNKDSRSIPLYEPLFDAVENMNVEMVTFLLERGADPKDVSPQFFSGNLKPRDIGRHSPQDFEKIGDLLSAYEATHL